MSDSGEPKGGDDVDMDEEMEEDDEDDDESGIDEEEGGEEAGASGEEKKEKKVYLPGEPLGEGEELECDESAYVLFQQAHAGAPCLSFDIIPDHLGDKRETFPATCYCVAGTQSARSHGNNLIVMKMTNLRSNKKANKENDDSEDSDSSSDEEDEDDKPELEAALVAHQGTINRVRAHKLPDGKVLAASWSELAKVHIWDLTRPLQAVEDPHSMTAYVRKKESPKPLFTFKGHLQEGYAMDWSPTNVGWLVTGDCVKNIHLWKPTEGGKWSVDQKPFVGHTASVEDLQWSPTEKTVFASCSVDRTIGIWDVRAPPQKGMMLSVKNAHENDINVISWNRQEPFIVSGGDDGKVNVWDLRDFQVSETPEPVAKFKHHTQPVTTVEWHPTDSSIFASGGGDNQIAIWDLAVERGDDPNDIPEVPAQLLFIHQGQEDIKELHWHRQIPGLIISTAHSGFHIFKTISV